MYTQRKVHVHEKYHERIKSAVTQDRPLGVKLNLTKDGDDVILLTPGQLIKIERAIRAGKKVLTIRMSRKQVQANVKVEGGFLGTLLSFTGSSHTFRRIGNRTYIRRCRTGEKGM